MATAICCKYYDHTGQLVAAQTPDEGLSEITYDSEGKKRFSQNAVQKQCNRFSYINYDKFGRTVESGEYTTGTLTGTTNVFFQNYYQSYTAPNSGNLGTNTIIDQLDGVLDSQCGNTYYTTYEAPTGSADIPNGWSYYSQYSGKYLNGAVCRTWNANTSTWYNYDNMGRNTATVKQIYDSEYTGLKTNLDDQIKTSETTFNNFNSLTTASTYQKNSSAEFFEIRPVYDALLRPYQSYVNSFAGSGQKLSENYFDKMGRPVRTVIGNNLQGVDMVYTLDGKLKAINHPGLYAAYDRGGDNGDFTGANPLAVNKDIFGEILEYHYNDYEAANSYSVNSITSGNSKYDGLVYRQRFKTQNDVNGTTTGANYIDYGGANQVQLNSWSNPEQQEMIFSYTYDQYKQLATSAFGTYNNNSNTFNSRNEYREGGPSGGNISYDANGNITRLVRATYSISGSLVNFDDLTYTINPTGNSLTSIVDAANNTFSNSVNFKTSSTVTPQSFTYNASGQLTASPAENVSSVTYYPNGQVKMITFSNGNTTEYFFDDAGNKYKVRLTDNINDKLKTTWYIGPAI